MTSHRHPWVWLLAITVIAFLLRLGATILFEGLNEGPSRRGFGADAVEFNAIAANLVQYGEYAIDPHRPTSFRAPGFPLALAGVYRLFGVNNFLAAHLFLCLVGAALPLLVFLLARETTALPTANRGTPQAVALHESAGGADSRGMLVPLLAAGLAAIYPNLAYYSIHFASEPLFTLLFIAGLWLLLRAVNRWRGEIRDAAGTRRTSSFPDFALSGLLFGLASLTRPLAFYMAPLLALTVVWILRKAWRSALPGVLLFLVLLMLPIAPWAARNYALHQRLVLFTTNGGSTLWGANNAIVMEDPQHRGGWISTNYMPEEKARVLALPNEADRDRLERELGKAFLKSHIRDIPRLAWYKFRAFWTPFCDTPNRKFNLIVGLTYGPMIPLMATGFWLLIRRRGAMSPEVVLLAVPIVATVLITLVFYGSTRFRSTLEPILLIFAAMAIGRITSHVTIRPDPSA